MSQPTPSKSLTLYRTILASTTKLASSSTTRHHPSLPARRPFTTSPPYQSRTHPDMGPGKAHTIDKAAKGDHNIQSNESRQGQKQRAVGGADNATLQRDSTQSGQKAKAENPKAPGPIIGMEDERGGKGL